MAKRDFDNDGKSDVLWSTTNGLVLWSSIGMSFVAGQRADGTPFNANFSGGAIGWRIIDSADFTGDGHADVFFSKIDGSILQNQIHLWDTTRLIGAGSNATGLIPKETELLVGHFSGDARADLLMRAPDGVVTVATYTYNPNPGRGQSYLGPPQVTQAVSGAVDASWHFAGTGDFNGDGIDDILWRNDSGLVTDWFGTGGSFAENDANSTLVDNDWQVAEIGDFNGDGKDDILWRRSDGQITHWLSEGTSFDISSVFSLNVNPSWHVGQTGDYNGDGMDDILWFNDNGLVTTWMSTGLGFAPNDANTTVLPDGFVFP